MTNGAIGTKDAKALRRNLTLAPTYLLPHWKRRAATSEARSRKNRRNSLPLMPSPSPLTLRTSPSPPTLSPLTLTPTLIPTLLTPLSQSCIT